MKRYVDLAAFLVLATCIVHAPAPAACDPRTDELCCTSDSDCTMYVNPALCVYVAMNRSAADKLEKAALPPSGDCKAEYVDQLKKAADSKKPVCVYQSCDFE